MTNPKLRTLEASVMYARVHVLMCSAVCGVCALNAFAPQAMDFENGKSSFMDFLPVSYVLSFFSFGWWGEGRV